MSTKGWPTFLAATHKQLVVVTAGVVETIHKDEGEYYGITWDNHNVYLAHQKNFKSPDAPVISVLDSSLRVTHQLAGSCVDVHQILCHKDSLYVTNTSSNSIDVHTSGKVKNFNWTSHSVDVNHINSLFFNEESLWSCHHNLVSRGEHTYSELVQLSKNLQSIQRKIRIGKDLHNVFINGKMLYTLSSAEGDLLEVDLSTNKVTRRTAIGMWPRGFAATKDFFLVGVSTKIDRSNRPDGRSEVHLVDRHTLRVLDKVCIDNVGVIYDVRVTSEKDAAHNSYTFPGRL